MTKNFKTMEKKAIEEIMESEGLLERFVKTLVEEINNDDEAYYKKERQLLELCLTNGNADDFFIAICGWNVDSIIDKCKQDSSHLDYARDLIFLTEGRRTRSLS